MPALGRFRAGRIEVNAQATSHQSSQPVAVVGAGLIGRAWAIVFARGGHPVRLHDADAATMAGSLAYIGERLKELEAENERLKRLVAQLALDKQMLQEVAQKKW